MFFSTAPSLKNMINFVIGKQKACILMRPVSAIKVWHSLSGRVKTFSFHEGVPVVQINSCILEQMCLSKSLGGLCTFKWDNRCDHFVRGDVLLESLWVPKGPQSGSKWLMMVYSTQEKCVRFIWSFSVHHLRPLDNFIQWNPEFWHFWDGNFESIKRAFFGVYLMLAALFLRKNY